MDMDMDISHSSKIKEANEEVNIVTYVVGTLEKPSKDLI